MAVSLRDQAAHLWTLQRGLGGAPQFHAESRCLERSACLPSLLRTCVLKYTPVLPATLEIAGVEDPHRHRRAVHARRPARVKRHVSDDLDDLLLRNAVVQRAVDVLAQLVRA